MQMEEPDGWMTSAQMVDWAKSNLNITKSNIQMTDEEIGRTMRWIGVCSMDTAYVDGQKPKLGKSGIGNMLFMTLMEFPGFYVKHELWQQN